MAVLDYSSSLLGSNFFRSWKQAGIRSVSMQLLPNARHDLLHEDTHTAARKALRNWMESTLD